MLLSMADGLIELNGFSHCKILNFLSSILPFLYFTRYYDYDLLATSQPYPAHLSAMFQVLAIYVETTINA